MKKIKASEILTMNPELSLEKIKKFGFFAVDMGGDKYLYENKPACEDFRLNGVWGASTGGILFVGHNTDWVSSLREIDFTNSEPEPSQEVEHLIKQASDWLMKNTKLDVTVIVDLSEYLRKINL